MELLLVNVVEQLADGAEIVAERNAAPAALGCHFLKDFTVEASDFSDRETVQFVIFLLVVAKATGVNPLATWRQQLAFSPVMFATVF